MKYGEYFVLQILIVLQSLYNKSLFPGECYTDWTPMSLVLSCCTKPLSYRSPFFSVLSFLNMYLSSHSATLVFAFAIVLSQIFNISGGRLFIRVIQSGAVFGSEVIHNFAFSKSSSMDCAGAVNWPCGPGKVICGSIGPIALCFPIIISSHAQEIIVAADIAF